VCVSGYSEAEGALWESDASVGFHGNYGLMQWSGLLEIQYMLYASPSVRAHIAYTVCIQYCIPHCMSRDCICVLHPCSWRANDLQSLDPDVLQFTWPSVDSAGTKRNNSRTVNEEAMV